MNVRDEGSFVNITNTLHDLLIELEEGCGFELDITSSYREGDERCHGRGLAVDIACTNGANRMLLVREALSLDFVRIGIYDRHVHLDLCRGDYPQQVIWIGVSR